MNLTDRLAQMNIILPAPAAAVGAYVPARRLGALIYVSGQLPLQNGKLLATGPVPQRCSLELAAQAARQCAINALAAAAVAAGGVDQLTGVLRVGVFVQCADGFSQQPTIANAASEFLVECFGPPGRHVRAAVGTNALPLDATVELEVIFVTT